MADPTIEARGRWAAVVAAVLFVTPCAAQDRSASAPPSAVVEQAAVLVDWEGTVSVTRAADGRRVPADYLMHLFERDVVRTGPGSSATIYYDGGQAAHSVQKFNKLSVEKRRALLAFLNTLRAPPID